MNYTVLEEERCGRLLIAARDIKAGEVIFCDSPGAVGPDNNPGPLCLTCYKRLPGLVYRCRHCSWPLCGPHCQEGGPHVRECQLLSKSCPKFVIKDFDKPYKWYNAIMALRVLWLKKNEPETWRLLDMLMDHAEVADKEDKMINGVVDFIVNVCKLNFTEREVRHVMGIIDTNAYIIGENPNRDIDIQGLFPITSIINHSCHSNTICFATDNFKFVCRAVVDIQKGCELTTNYLHYHYHNHGLSYRAPELSQFWHFTCSCRRCRDPSEFGSLVDAVLCEDCEAGPCLPLNNSPGAEWMCGDCYSSQPAQDVLTKISYWRDMLDNSSGAETKELMSYLYQLSKIFHRNHYFILEVKRRIMETISQMAGYQEGTLADAWLEKKLEFCVDHLAVQSQVSPGLSEYRAYLSSHTAYPLYLLTKRRYVEKLITREELMRRMEEVGGHLDLTINIWGEYRQRSEERREAEAARELLAKLDRDYLHRNY